jgi:regulatory protein
MVSRKANSSSSGSDAGDDSGRQRRDRKRVKPPLTEAALRDLALHYAARFATTAARVEAYLARKIRERGLAEDRAGGGATRTIQVDIPALVARLVELGYVDDDAYARARARDLGARGYGGRRVEETLRFAGVGAKVRAAHAPGEAAGRRAAALMAQKKRIGPWSAGRDAANDPLARRKAHEKAVAAMLRAGHQYDHVRFVLAAKGPEDVEQWLEEAADQEGSEGIW